MSAFETIMAVLGSSLLASIVTAWTTLRGKSVDTLHLSEIEFRKALLARVEQLEAGRTNDRQRIQELEGENRSLRIEIDQLKRAMP